MAKEIVIHYFHEIVHSTQLLLIRNLSIIFRNRADTFKEKVCDRGKIFMVAAPMISEKRNPICII